MGVMPTTVLKGFNVHFPLTMGNQTEHGTWNCSWEYVGGLEGLYRVIVPLMKIEDGVYGDLIMIYPKPCSIYLRGTIFWGQTLLDCFADLGA